MTNKTAAFFHRVALGPFRGMERETGFCLKHQTLAIRYGDLSWTCFHELVTEEDGKHRNGDFLPTFMLATPKDVAAIPRRYRQNMGLP